MVPTDTPPTQDSLGSQPDEVILSSSELDNCNDTPLQLIIISMLIILILLLPK